MTYSKYSISVLLTILLSSLPLKAMEVADTVLSLNEVSVTAIKQSIDIASLPGSSTLLTADEVNRLNIVTMKGASEVAPNFYIPDYGSRMTSTIYMRGIGARIDQPVIGLNVDNIPYLNKDNYDFDLVDIERIEVLRGPQSTLYGRNTMGGLINIYTLSPMKYQGLRLTAEYSRANSLKASVSYYHKINSSLGMAYNAYFTHTDGFFTNLYNGRKLDKENQGSVRWKTVWRPLRNLTVENVASALVSRQGGYPYMYLETGEINYNDTCFYRRTSITDGLTAKLTLDNMTLSSITSFQYINDNMTLDQDFTPQPYFTLTQKRHEWALTQDFVGRGSVGNYNWLAGLFGFYKRTNMLAPVTFKETGIDELILKNINKYSGNYPRRWNEDSFVLGSEFVNPVWGVALYHQSNYNIGHWDFSLGLRLDIERTSLDYHSICNTSFRIMNLSDGTEKVYANIPVDIDDTGDIAKTYVEFVPKFTAAYKFGQGNASQVYMSAARGYKAGGFNTQMFSDVLQQRLMEVMGLSSKYDVDQIISYKPEVSWNYEIGAHISMLENALSAQIATFYIDCRDQQVTMFPDGMTTGRIMANAGRTRSCGAEISLVYRPSTRWEINTSYGYTDARFREFYNGISDFSGKRIPYAPRNTFFAGVTYRQPMPQGSFIDGITANVNCRGVGEIVWDEANTVTQPFYALAGASLQFDFDKDYSLTVWGENLTDTKYNTFYFVSIGNTFLQRGKPLCLGATLRMNF